MKKKNLRQRKLRKSEASNAVKKARKRKASQPVTKPKKVNSLSELGSLLKSVGLSNG